MSHQQMAVCNKIEGRDEGKAIAAHFVDVTGFVVLEVPLEELKSGILIRDIEEVGPVV